ncbi:D-alanine--D-alanine ligase [Candidatus Nitrosacidococcus tergens]|uniref:D-alanine--D-alanine ligase n=1 Tax=Candidatus Nitrosacidococcus tergens TaxID=553981 RepID=A0A7G1QB36_9GAMM|nr:D-alanine--D-alanine ligase [Candidatus Nitrosacidococcus tergens]CAB1276927.1 D-alanine:D-alanine ligase [Candidatus Nitrosacidococcus tergens]
MKLITKKQDWGKVAVLMGGNSSERDISLESGQAVLQALIDERIDAYSIDVNKYTIDQLQIEQFQRAFIAIHGRGGEDGIIQGALDLAEIPYTGSGVLGSALAMDKLKSKQLWRGLQLPTADFLLLDETTNFPLVAQQLSLPLIVKPARQGSSVGIFRVDSIEDFEIAYSKAKVFDNLILAEQWLSGVEYTASILLGQPLPIIRLETPHKFYDFEAKYLANTTRYLCPCGLSRKSERLLQDIALQAFDTLGASGWGRVDFKCDKEGNPYLLEVNTVPGMTNHSLIPMAARAAGISFNNLVLKILESSEKNY